MYQLLKQLASLEGDDRFCVFTREELEKIHGISLRILHETGCRIQHERVRALLRDAGHEPDEKTEIVRFDPGSIEAAIEKFRKPEPPREIPKKLGAELGGIAAQIYEPTADKTRPATKKDLENACIIGEASGDVTAVGQVFVPQDVPQVTSPVHAVQVMVTRSRKSRFFEYMNAESLAPVKEILTVAAGSWEAARAQYRPSYPCFINSPLHFTHEPLETALQALELGFPVRFGLPMSIAGATAPVTFPGTVALSNAETLAGLVLADLLEQPFLYEASPVVFDPQTGGSNYSGPDRVILDMSTLDICRFYGLPLHTHLKHSDPVAPDFQSGFERAYGLFLQLLGGMTPGLVCGITGPTGAAGCLEQILLDVECLQVFEKMLQPIEVSERDLCADLIQEVGIGGDFLAAAHTVERFRSVLWFPELMKRYSTGVYNEEPRNALRNAIDRVQEILKNHDSHPLSSKQESEIAKIVAAADKQHAAQ